MREARGKTVVVGMSGGVDSSVAAWLLRERGFDVRGLFMENWEDDEEDTYCTTAEDFQDARQVAAELDIPLQKVNFAAEYRERVFRYFLSEYEAGRTPNPDVLCNSEIKFRAFLDYAVRLGADWIATGHYCRVRHDGGAGHLLKGLDPAKDQSYFLHGVASAALSRTLFPLGDLEKTEVREMAVDAGFDNFDKKDSTGICFIGERPMREFLGKYLPAQPGEIRTPVGQVIGRHEGLMYYTIGQRKGLGIGGVPDAPDDPWYVVDKDIANNRLIAAQGHDHPLLHHGALRATDLHWINASPGEIPFRCRAKTRYRQPDQPCLITRLDDDQCIVEFDRTQRAISPGQYVVFYEGDECLGGGIIDRALEGGADRPLAHTG